VPLKYLAFSRLFTSHRVCLYQPRIKETQAVAPTSGDGGRGSGTMALADALRRTPASIDVSDPRLYQDDTWRPLFARLRRDDPVHDCQASPFGPYWSVTRYDDIVQVELDHENYSSSSELGGTQIADQPKGAGNLEFPTHGSAKPYRASSHGRADRGAVEPGQSRSPDPPTHIRRARRAAAQRDVRLDVAGLDRPDQQDADDLVGFSVG
jgi:hypothetical protein